MEALAKLFFMRVSIAYILKKHILLTNVWKEYALLVENIRSLRVYAGQGRTIDKSIRRSVSSIRLMRYTLSICLMSGYAFAIFIHINA